MRKISTFGLRKRSRVGGDVWYWIAPAKDVLEGYAPKSITLDPDASEAERIARCRAQHDDLMAWRRGRDDNSTRYSFAWLIHRYKTDEHSPYHKVKGKTRESYDGMLKIIGGAIGHLRMDPRLERGVYHPRIVGHHVRQWHADCGKPDAKGKPRPSRARHMIAVLRILASYAVEIAVPGADAFRALLSTIRFPTTAARVSAPTRSQVVSIVKAALDMGYRSIAITTLAQFIFTERRISIIGEWEGDQWRPGWVWQNISPDWVITYHQTKVGRVERSYDLKETPALLEMLQAIPEEKRVGAVIINERTGLQWRYRHYVSVFRKIARVADVPDDICSMDMRAGGATEAGKIQGISSFDIQAAGGWSDAKMASRYTRDTVGRAQNVVRLRQANAVTDVQPGDFVKHPADCGIYFLQARGGQNCVKIGYTTNLHGRTHSLATGCPYPVEVIGLHRGPPELEKFLHMLFKEHRTNLEWFLPVQAVLDCAKRLPDEVVKQFGNGILERARTAKRLKAPNG